jgi:hypothetical protein
MAPPPFEFASAIRELSGWTGGDVIPARIADSEIEGLTHARICHSRSIRVDSDTMFSEFLRFKSPSSVHECGECLSKRRTSCLRQTPNSKLGCCVCGDDASTCSHDVNEPSCHLHNAIMGVNLVCLLQNRPLIAFKSICVRKRDMKS